MINIAICDDNLTMTSQIEEILYDIGKEQVLKLNCDVFFDGSTLIKSINEGTYYDLIYLDIEMPKVNGIHTAEAIRCLDIPTLIVYISSYEKYLKDLFNTEPFRFLSKPINLDIFKSAFMDAYKRIKQKSEYFSFSYNKSYFKIPLNEIYYFESRNRVIYINKKKQFNKIANLDKMENECRFYGKMNDIEKQLSDKNCRFLRIHQSYLVNFDYIKHINFSSITLNDGTILQISEDRQKKVRTQFCTMIGMEV